MTGVRLSRIKTKKAATKDEFHPISTRIVTDITSYQSLSHPISQNSLQSPESFSLTAVVTGTTFRITMGANNNRLQFQRAWGKIVSGDLDLLGDGFAELKQHRGSGNQWFPSQALLTRADVTFTFTDLAERVLSADTLDICLQLLYCRGLGITAKFVNNLLLRWAKSTDPNLQEKAAWGWLEVARSSLSNAEILARDDAVADAIVNLSTGIDMKQKLDSKKLLSETLFNVSMDDISDQILGIVMSSALRALQTAWRDPDSDEYANSLLNVVGCEPSSLLIPHHFDCIFRYVASGQTRLFAFQAIEDILALPEEELGGTDLTSLFVKPAPLNFFRSIFTRTGYDAVDCWEYFFDMWSKLVAVEPRAVAAMIRLDFLGDTFTHITNNWYDPCVSVLVKRYFPPLVSLMDKMLNAAKQDTVEYFFNCGFFKFLAAVTKVRSLSLTEEVSDMFEELERVIRCFENAASIPFASVCPMPTAVTVATTALANYEDVGRPAWVHVTDFDNMPLALVPIDSLEAFATASGNMFIAALFVDLLSPSPGDETVSHNEKWAWLINPNPVCLAVMRHLLHDKPATKKALFAAAGIHELSRSARDFEPRPDDPTRSYYRDEKGNMQDP